MTTRTQEIFQCDVCETEFVCKERAAECEKSHIQGARAFMQWESGYAFPTAILVKSNGTENRFYYPKGDK